MTDTVDVAHRVPPLVLIQGPEGVLADRAVAQLIDDLRVATPDVEVIHLQADTYEAGELITHASPSLFGEDKAIVVHDLDEAPDELQTDLLDLLATSADDITLIVLHKSGNRGKKVLDTLKKARARLIEAPAIKSDRDKADFAAHEFRRARRKATGEAVTALIEAVGKDVRELASACQQLIDDTTGVIDADVVMRYHGGKVEATGFQVADAAIAGNTHEALRLLRHAFAVGVDPVPIVAVLASQLRQLAKVGAAGRGNSATIARDLKMAPWQVDRARRSLSGWDGAALGRAIQAVAAADFAVKGGGAAKGGRSDPYYAVEKAVLTIVGERQGTAAGVAPR
ncbi:DNA polymerase III subunit delta [Janibacter sp. G56]|uniref:DNA polymerase III subunit delta n=1 Tax=Janibacter sp. G56 TaxID=3418717 RepID=UPI003D058E1B